MTLPRPGVDPRAAARHVWGYDTPSGQRTVDVHVAQVRAKLGEHDVMRTVRGVGYAAQAPRERPGT